MEKAKRTAAIAIVILIVMILSATGTFVFLIDRFRQQIFEADLQHTRLQDELAQRYEYTDLLNRNYQAKKEELSTFDDILARIEEERQAYYSEIIELEEKIRNGQTRKKIAYLTFDDGPYTLTTQFLNVLDEYQVKATFFYLMKSAETGYEDVDEIYDRIYRRIIQSGHTLGNHTASHKFGEEGVYQSVDYFLSDLKKNRDFIYDRYGYITTIMRFPGGSETSSLAPAIIERLDELDYVYVDWNAQTGDGGKNVLSAETYTSNVLNDTEGKNILVVLMHDYSENTLKALPDIIKGLRKQGYILLPLCDRSAACH